VLHSSDTINIVSL